MLAALPALPAGSPPTKVTMVYTATVLLRRGTTAAHPDGAVGIMTRAILLLTAFIAHCLTVTAPQQILDCLGGIDADIVSPQNTLQHDLARQVANKRVIHSPIAVVYPRNVEAVQEAVKCSCQAGVSATARAGGHSYEGECASCVMAGSMAGSC